MVLGTWYQTPFVLGTNSHPGLNLSVRVVDCLLTEAKRKTLLVSFTPRYRKKETLNTKMNYFVISSLALPGLN